MINIDELRDKKCKTTLRMLTENSVRMNTATPPCSENLNIFLQGFHTALFHLFKNLVVNAMSTDENRIEFIS